MPLPAWDEATGWEPDPVPFDDLPHVEDPPAGFVATANNLPSTTGPHLSCDFLDGYRVARISEALAARTDWDVPATLALQLDRLSLPWREMRDLVLAAVREDAALTPLTALLEAWDGQVAAESPAAALFEFFLAEMVGRVVRARAPHAAEWALGTGLHLPHPDQHLRRAPHLPPGAPAAGAAAGVVPRRLGARRCAGRCGRRPTPWLAPAAGPTRRDGRWGEVRPLTFEHPVAVRKPLDRIFNLGPYPWGGDANTVSPAPTDAVDPTANPVAVASLRMADRRGRMGAEPLRAPRRPVGQPLLAATTPTRWPCGARGMPSPSPGRPRRWPGPRATGYPGAGA